MLWFGSFQRNYRFYTLRIDHARLLESELGFSLLTKGHKLGNPPHFVEIGDRALEMPWYTRNVSIQRWTQRLMLVQ